MSNASGRGHWAGVLPNLDRPAGLLPVCGIGTLDNGVTYISAEFVNCPACLAILDRVRAAIQGQPVPAPPSPTQDQLADPASFAPAITVQLPRDLEIPRSFPAEPRALTPQALLQIGATLPEGTVKRADIDSHLLDQRRQYQNYTKDALVEELVRRDEGEIRRGQEAADGRMAGRLLREFVRGVLYSADKAELTVIEASAKQGQIANILKLLGAEPADARQIRLEGSTVGDVFVPPAYAADGVSREIAIQNPVVPQLPSPETADAIRDRWEQNKPKVVTSTMPDPPIDPRD